MAANVTEYGLLIVAEGIVVVEIVKGAPTVSVKLWLLVWGEGVELSLT